MKNTLENHDARIRAIELALHDLGFRWVYYPGKPDFVSHELWLMKNEGAVLLPHPAEGEVCVKWGFLYDYVREILDNAEEWEEPAIPVLTKAAEEIFEAWRKASTGGRNLLGELIPEVVATRDDWGYSHLKGREAWARRQAAQHLASKHGLTVTADYQPRLRDWRIVCRELRSDFQAKDAAEAILALVHNHNLTNCNSQS